MDIQFDLQTSYRAIRDAARDRKCITFRRLAEVNGVSGWGRDIWIKLSRHLADLAAHATRHGWPMPNAIVVPGSGELSEGAIEEFLKAADDCNVRRTTNLETFLNDQRAAMFIWAQTVPDHLGFPEGA